LFVPAILCASLVTGCQKSAPAPSAVTGKVTLDGKPLAAGTIQFFAADKGVSAPVSATITNGEYSASVVPGAQRVESKSPKSLGKMNDPDMPANMMSEQSVETLPAIYNLNSQLTCNIESKETVANFELKSR